MKTTLLYPNDPFDKYNTPIWALPQLGYIQKTLKCTIISFHTVQGTGSAFFEVFIPREGNYVGLINKESMNMKAIPSLEYVW